MRVITYVKDLFNFLISIPWLIREFSKPEIKPRTHDMNAKETRPKNHTVNFPNL